MGGNFLLDIGREVEEYIKGKVRYPPVLTRERKVISTVWDGIQWT